MTDDFDHVRSRDEIEDVRQQFAANLRLLRKTAGMSLDDVADAYGCTRSWISRLESGSREPKLTVIVRLARALNVEPGDLMRDIG